MLTIKPVSKPLRQARLRAALCRTERSVQSRGVKRWVENVLASFDSEDESDRRASARDRKQGNADSAKQRDQLAMERGVMLQAGVGIVPETGRMTRMPGSCVVARDSVDWQAGFGWGSCRKGGWYKMLSSKAQDIRALGVDFLWLPPPSQSVSCEGYMPGQLYDLNTPYGSERELRELILHLQEVGVSALADIVINHRCADQQDDHGVWNMFTDKVKHPGKSIAWGQWAIVRGDGYCGTGGADSGADFGPAPDLDHTNPGVHESLRDWMNWLHKDVGFSGWRLDYVKGYAPEWVKYYVDETVGREALNVGEYWSDMKWTDSCLETDQDAARQELCDYIDGCEGAVRMFDFPTKGILQEAVKRTEYFRLKDNNGKPTGLLGWWPSKAVTFIDNHDTGSTQCHWPFPKDNVMTGYAYIMTHPGMPCIQWEHAFEDGHYYALCELVQLRRRNNINMRSKVTILSAEADIYVARTDDKVVVKLGPRYDMGTLLPRSEDGWVLAASGKDYAIWEKKQQGTSR